MKFWIVTPSFNQRQWLRLCMYSVRDQCAEAGITVHHHVQDGGSSDGTREFLKEYGERQDSGAMPGYSFSFSCARDEGMYDAINSGWRMAPLDCDILAHLNCDEQYLPAALVKVKEYCEHRPNLEILFGDVVVIDENGDYKGSRQIVKPGYYHTLTCYLGTLTAATFFRRHVLQSYDAWFDSSWRAAGDAVWIMNLLRRGAAMGKIGDYLSAFTYTGDNLSLSACSVSERARIRAMAPFWVRHTSLVWQALYRIRRLLHGFYRPKPFRYEIYTQSSGDKRQSFNVNLPRPFQGSKA